MTLVIVFELSYALVVGFIPAASTFSAPRSPRRPVSLLSSCSYVCPIARAAASWRSPGNNCWQTAYVASTSLSDRLSESSLSRAKAGPIDMGGGYPASPIISKVLSHDSGSVKTSHKILARSLRLILPTATSPCEKTGRAPSGHLSFSPHGLTMQ